MSKSILEFPTIVDFLCESGTYTKFNYGVGYRILSQFSRQTCTSRNSGVALKFKMPKITEEIRSGFKIERLTVGELVWNPLEHELYYETNGSYIRQGRLRECTCSCGQVKLISEGALRTGRITSCGCKRQEILQSARYTSKIKQDEKRFLLSQIKFLKDQIKLLRIATVRMQTVPAYQRDYRAIQANVDEIRSLSGKLGQYEGQARALKDSRRWTQAQCDAQSKRMKAIWNKKLGDQG